MARPKRYDDATARAGLMATFLERGFADTSIGDMERGSGINRRQIYNDYGDKLAVFVQALNDFSDQAATQILSPLETGLLGVDDVETTLFGLVGAGETTEGRLGCLFCNSARETVAAEPEVQPVIDRFFRRIEAGYQQALDRGVAAGEMPASTDTTQLARFYLGVHVGLCVLGRAGEDQQVLHDLATAALHRISPTN